MTKQKFPVCRVNWNKPYRVGTICNYVDEVTNECKQEDPNRCPCGGIVRIPRFEQPYDNATSKSEVRKDEREKIHDWIKKTYWVNDPPKYSWEETIKEILDYLEGDPE